MDINQIRALQKSHQSPITQSMGDGVVRIGDRETTGLHQAIYPDGSTTHGIKIFNAAHDTGDTVVAWRREDGLLVMDSAKAAEEQKQEEFWIDEEKREGYLQGQTWNREEPPSTPRISIDLAPGSPNLVLENSGNKITFRVSSDRPVSKKTAVQLRLAGGAYFKHPTNPPEYTFGNISPSAENANTPIVFISQNRRFVDIDVTPIVEDAFFDVMRRVVVMLEKDPINAAMAEFGGIKEKYLVSSEKSIVEANIGELYTGSTPPAYRVEIELAPGSPSELPANTEDFFVVRAKLDQVLAPPRLATNIGLITRDADSGAFYRRLNPVWGFPDAIPAIRAAAGGNVTSYGNRDYDLYLPGNPTPLNVPYGVTIQQGSDYADFYVKPRNTGINSTKKKLIPIQIELFDPYSAGVAFGVKTTVWLTILPPT